MSPPPRPLHLLRASPALLRVGFATMVAYRAEMVVWILTATMPLVMLALWDAAAADGPLMGFGQAEFARYFTVTLIVRQLTGAWIVWELNEQIRRGSLSPLLLRPLNPLIFELAQTAAALPFRIVVLAPILGALCLWRPELATLPTAAQALAGAVSILLAFLLSFVVQVLFGILAFWFEQSMGFFGLWFAAYALLGGYVVPLALLPEGVGAVARWLPFQATLAAPVDILIGLEPDLLGRLGVQAAWTLALTALAAWMWRRGLRRYGAVGA